MVAMATQHPSFHAPSPTGGDSQDITPYFVCIGEPKGCSTSVVCVRFRLQRNSNLAISTVKIGKNLKQLADANLESAIRNIQPAAR